MTLAGDVLFECVVDEEAGGNCTFASILRGYRADAGVFVEPSGAETIYLGHRGGLRFRVAFRGQAAQLLKRDSGINAIEKMHTILAALEEFRKQRRASVSHPAFQELANPVPLYIGEIRGGSWFSSTPLECVVDGTLGWRPGETLASVQRSLRDSLLQFMSPDPWLARNPPEVTFPSNWVEPCATDPGAAAAEGVLRCGLRRGRTPAAAVHGEFRFGHEVALPLRRHALHLVRAGRRQCPWPRRICGGWFGGGDGQNLRRVDDEVVRDGLECPSEPTW